MKKTDKPADGVFIIGNNNKVNFINNVTIYNETPRRQDNTITLIFIVTIVSVLTVSLCHPDLLADYIRLIVSVAIGR